jgi:hypothetical protein
MSVEEYLKNCPIDLRYIAGLMYPTNKAANSYLSKKLNGERPFTEKDAERAINALKSIGTDWKSLDGFKS